ncbi:MAG: hypothetical protein PHV20_02110 [Bacteroidales bacterium]|nr:hypothetical protein [Bacteroidales bacterium]
MKKITFLLIVALVSLFASNANAAVWQVAAPADLYATYNDAGFISGDIIELTTDGGAYTWGTKLSTVTKSFTVRAAAGLAARPVITPLATATLFSVNNSTALTPSIAFDGVEFAGNATITTFLIAGKTTTGGTFSVNVNNCKFTGFGATTYFSYANSQSTTQITSNFGDLTVTNSIFIGGNTLIAAGAVSGSNHFNVPNNMTFVNNYFKTMVGSVINSNVSTMLSNSLMVNHCTFDGCATTTLKEISVGTTGTTGAPAVIKNTLFANRGASVTANICGGVGVEANTNNAVYYTGAGAVGTIYPTSALGDYVTAGFNVDPVISGTTYVATAPTYLAAGNDNETIGYHADFLTGVKATTSTTSFSVIAHNNSLQVNGVKEGVNFKIYSVTGSEVANGVINNGKVNTQLTKGIYVMKADNKVAKFAVR